MKAHRGSYRNKEVPLLVLALDVVEDGETQKAGMGRKQDDVGKIRKLPLMKSGLKMRGKVTKGGTMLGTLEPIKSKSGIKTEKQRKRSLDTLTLAGEKVENTTDKMKKQRKNQSKSLSD